MDGAQESPATWKFKWYEALTIGLKPKDLPVAMLLLQHASGQDGSIHPSQKLMAYYLQCHVSKVERAINALAKAGVITKVRWSQNTSNRYRFVDTWRNVQIERRAALKEEWQDIAQKDPAILQGQEHETDALANSSTLQF